MISRLTGSKIRPLGQNAGILINFRNVIKMCQNTRSAALDQYCNNDNEAVLKESPNNFDRHIENGSSKISLCLIQREII